MTETFPQYVVDIVASLFPDDVHNGSDCRNEIGREGQRCRICEEHYQRWINTQKRVQDAINATDLARLFAAFEDLP